MILPFMVHPREIILLGGISILDYKLTITGVFPWRGELFFGYEQVLAVSADPHLGLLDLGDLAFVDLVGDPALLVFVHAGLLGLHWL